MKPRTSIFSLRGIPFFKRRSAISPQRIFIFPVYTEPVFPFLRNLFSVAMKAGDLLFRMTGSNRSLSPKAKLSAVPVRKKEHHMVNHK